jgi:hypothetical protein
MRKRPCEKRPPEFRAGKEGEEMERIKMVVALCLVALLAGPGMVSAKKKKSKVPMVSYVQYNLDPGPNQMQSKSNIEISLKAIRFADIYKYPGLFAFNAETIAKGSSDPRQVKYLLERMYPKGPDGLSWENPFATADGRISLLLLAAKIVNNTDHILRMKDARVYLIPEGKEPLSAIAKFEDLLEVVDVFERLANQHLAEQSQGGLIRIGKTPQLPKGFYRTMLTHNRASFKLINDLGKEVLPGFTYEGFLIFPSAPDIQGTAKISFFDITTKMDMAGNPVEKARFDFALKREDGSMWYDKEEKMWKEGAPADSE